MGQLGIFGLKVNFHLFPLAIYLLYTVIYLFIPVFKTWATALFNIYLFVVLIVMFLIGKLLRTCCIQSGWFNPTQRLIDEDRPKQLPKPPSRPGFMWIVPQHLNAKFAGLKCIIIIDCGTCAAISTTTMT